MFLTSSATDVSLLLYILAKQIVKLLKTNECSSNAILLAIEYFIDSKGERQNIKLLSTQNNYSPSFGLKKLVIFFISSDKTDKKLCRSWKYKTRCRTKRRGGQEGQGMPFDQGASRAQGKITAKSTGAPQNAWRLTLNKIQRT